MNTELSNDEPVADGYRLIIKYFYQKSIKDVRNKGEQPMNNHDNNPKYIQSEVPESTT